MKAQEVAKRMERTFEDESEEKVLGLPIPHQ